MRIKSQEPRIKMSIKKRSNPKNTCSSRLFFSRNLDKIVRLEVFFLIPDSLLSGKVKKTGA
jgi:hypothetical protein